MHRSRRTTQGTARAWISSTDASGTELAVTGTDAARLRLEALPDPEGAATVGRGVDRILWQSISERGGEVYAVAHRRPRRLRVSAATALGLLDAGVPTVLRTGATA